MEYLNQSALPRRLLQLAGTIPQGFGLKYAIRDYLSRPTDFPHPQPRDDRDAVEHIKYLGEDEIERRKIYFVSRIFHCLDCLRVCFKSQPPKPPAITPDTPIVKTEDPFPHIPASGAQGRSTRPIDPTEEESQKFVISAIKNSYEPHIHLELTVKGRGIFVEWDWIAVDCMVPNAERLSNGTDYETLQIYPPLEDMETLAKFAKNIVREALIPLSEELMDQDETINKQPNGKDSQPEDITQTCNYDRCIYLNHVRAESRQIKVDRELCLSGSLCECPSEHKCLCAGNGATYETTLDYKLRCLKYAFHALAYLDSIENMSIDGSSACESHQLELEIPNDHFETANPLHSIETYREVDENLTRWVYSRARNFALEIVTAEGSTP